MAAETNPERLRLEEAKARTQAWRKWGPYVSERQWGTVREDYSADGDAWDYFPHEHARQPRLSLGRGRHRRALRQQAASLHRLALWNGKDPILKERMFGLTQSPGQSRRGRQGALLLPRCDADLQLRAMLYKYPQAEFPYAHLVEENARRTRQQPEFEIIDTGIFDADRYFDVDHRICQGGDRRHPDAGDGAAIAAPSRPRSMCCRSSGFATPGAGSTRAKKPSLEQVGQNILVHHPKLGEHIVHFERADQIVFCDNETNLPKLYGVKSPHGYLQGRLPRICGERQQGRRQHHHPGHQGGGHP